MGAARGPIAMSKTLFHYTPVFSAVLILREGVIRRSSGNTPPYVWLSSNQTDEPTACRVFSSREKTSAYQGRARFVFHGCDATPWADLRLTRAVRRELEHKAERKGGRPEEWFVLLADVRSSDLPLEIETARVWQKSEHDAFLLQYHDLQPPNVKRGLAAYGFP
jgi:hypothetical protein